MAESRYPHNIWTHVYTDGSAVNAVKNGGSGFYVKFQDGDSESESVAGGRRCTNFKAEIIAIISAADFLIGHHKRCKDIVFFTDSMSTLHSLQSGSVDPALLELQRSLFTLSHKGSVTLQWIPAHVGLPGNERADQLAKVGSTLDQPNTQLTYLETKSLLRTVFKNERLALHPNYSAHRDPFWGLERAQQTTLTRLRSGHCRLNYHMTKLGIANSGMCPCGHPTQTPIHILQDCPRFSGKRQEIWPVQSSPEIKLWGERPDLIKTVGFFSSIGIDV